MRLVMKLSDTGSCTISAVYDGRGSVPPPIPDGCRVTERLTANAARELSGAAYKAAQIGRPMVAMWVLTCDLSARDRIGSGDLILSGEIRRFLDAVRKRVSRAGWGSFSYVWVAENPGNDTPHIHLLTSLDIPRSEFREWAAWSERVWGHGFVHMERLRDPLKAGHYLLKAVSYMGKGGDGSQGLVYGSRYGISKDIRIVRESIDLEVADGEVGGFSDLWDTPARRLGHGYWNGRALCYDDGTDLQNVLADLDVIL